MGSAVLSEAISAIRDWSVTDLKEKRDARVTGTFGSLVFNDEVQQARLPKAVYHALRRTMTHGEPLDNSVADAVAARSFAMSGVPASIAFTATFRRSTVACVFLRCSLIT